MVRILSEEPDPWEVEPQLPERKHTVPDLNQTKLYRKGETNDPHKLRKSKELIAREMWVDSMGLKELEERVKWCTRKYPVTFRRKCDYVIRQYMSRLNTPRFKEGPPQEVTRQIYEDIFTDNGRQPDIFNIFSDQQETADKD
eukprot:CAMPEP_0198728110 /NCGR_PEP_ID=MMETSP1475-20131203/6859_1 /TAXON_ID= ORGANISM="Unidentified sp., Strain CCMP1999" /NCGR_SAMPLE_ID=MMETSP1475 /ASSEMBLY_ACC=CAM_ASM_001111 /LENGTH=141 /DNA_ID=CAMNT_0044490367 /DNA_START=105 /DNA_END=530 /DNA_ORIENTATION=-